MVQVCFTTFLSLFATPLWADVKADGALWFDYGYFCAVETVETQEAEDTISGVVNLVDGPPDFLAKTTVIPAQIGIGFGIHVEVLPEFHGHHALQTGSTTPVSVHKHIRM